MLKQLLPRRREPKWRALKKFYARLLLEFAHLAAHRRLLDPIRDVPHRRADAAMLGHVVEQHLAGLHIGDDGGAEPVVVAAPEVGGELATRIRGSSKPVNLLINMTNLAWFGDSQAPAQQLRLSQLRSLETGLPALRATNTGITAVLGHDGKVQARLPEFTQDTLHAQVQGHSGKTPFVIWGNLPILSISCLLLIWGFLRHRRF
mgnify:CR=1 FL=1